jgi:hypothetical protein
MSRNCGGYLVPRQVNPHGQALVAENVRLKILHLILAEQWLRSAME